MQGFSTFKRALVLAPHTDDAELGCGGTIARLVSDGVKVSIVAFSAAEDSVPKGFARDVLRTEAVQAANALGVTDIRVLNYKVRYFTDVRQEILEQCVALRKELTPDLVLIPASSDTHQDHEVIHREGFRAFRNGCVLGYEMARNMVSFENRCHITLSEDDLEKKMQALALYRSQHGRGYLTNEIIRSWAIARGVQIGVTYAETFEMLRWIIR